MYKMKLGISSEMWVLEAEELQRAAPDVRCHVVLSKLFFFT